MPLYYAAFLGKTNLVKLLLDYGADPNGGLGSSASYTLGDSSPLAMAAMYGKVETMRLLLERGAYEICSGVEGDILWEKPECLEVLLAHNKKKGDVLCSAYLNQVNRKDIMEHELFHEINDYMLPVGRGLKPSKQNTLSYIHMFTFLFL